MARLSDLDRRLLLGGGDELGDLPGLVEDLDAQAYVRERLRALKGQRFYARLCIAVGFMLIAASFFLHSTDGGIVEIRMGGGLASFGVLWWAVIWQARSRLRRRIS
ncbi:MAG: hypothetical protein JWM36_2580 [Hyphomicrobiales bacterium]|nr:hypothetical protein [Hyphomicrobiales bacterium]